MVLSGPTGITTSSSQLRLKYPKTRSNEPSPFRIQPSKYGTTFWPDANLVCGIAVGNCCSSSAAQTSEARLFMGLFARGDALIEIRFVDVEEAHPREAHLVDRALAVADPVARV